MNKTDNTLQPLQVFAKLSNELHVALANIRSMQMNGYYHGFQAMVFVYYKPHVPEGQMPVFKKIGTVFDDAQGGPAHVNIDFEIKDAKFYYDLCSEAAPSHQMSSPSTGKPVGPYDFEGLLALMAAWYMEQPCKPEDVALRFYLDDQKPDKSDD